MHSFQSDPAMLTGIRQHRSRKAMKTARVAMTVFCCSVGLFAQAAHSQNASVRKPSPARPAAESPVAPDHPSLDGAIADLQRVVAATNSDLEDLQIDKWRSGWRAAWLKGNGHKQEAEQVASSLHHNLAEAMPELISDVQSSHGSVSSAFKLYNDLSVVVESLDSLIAIARTYGRKGEAGPLANDYAALGHLRQGISSYIQVTAASLEPKPKAPAAPAASGTLVKKVVIDDDLPESKPARKRTAAINH
jgi:hypothetical protein